MWESAELKERAKKIIKRNYWVVVVVSLIAYLVTGGVGEIYKDIDDMRDNLNNIINNEEYVEGDDLHYIEGIENPVVNLFVNTFGYYLILLGVKVLSIALILSLIVKLFVFYPITVGKNNFFMGIREKEKHIGDILYAYKSGNLINIVINMFLMNLFTYLWTLLLIIPGLVKSYEYRMIPYILSENPNISRKRAFELSKKMMYGNKMDTFILDLSFIGWHILSLFTFGILYIFYVNPYIESTNAELYAHLRKEALEEGYASESELIGF